MASDDDDMLWPSGSRGFVEVPSEIPDNSIERDFDSDARTMKNNEQRTIARAAADLTTEAMAQFALVGRDPGMIIATEMVRGIINGHGLVDPTRRFAVAYALRDIVEDFVIRELSTLVMPPRNSRMTWEEAAALVNESRSTLWERYRPLVMDPRDRKA